MKDYFLPAYKFQQLLDYLEAIQADAKQLCTEIGLDFKALRALQAKQTVPAIHYSNLYLASARYMQQTCGTVPWAAGMGGTSFRLMCFNMIASDTLGEALQRAAEFWAYTRPLGGHQLGISTEPSSGLVRLVYQFDCTQYQSRFAPVTWSRSEYFEPVVLSSGLRAICSLGGWLIGRSLELQSANIASSPINDKYTRVLSRTFQCPVIFDAPRTEMVLAAPELQQRIVQDNQSLQHFLGFVLYPFWLDEQSPATTSDAIKSIIGQLPNGNLPHFDEIAARLNMSASTLRRRLIEENTSYQRIKDERRRTLAIEYLHRKNLKIHDISEMLGFAETSSFVRSFRKWMGMTPKAYRDSDSASAFTPK